MPANPALKTFEYARATGAVDLTPAARLERLRNLARLMDEAFAIPGTSYRIGLDALIGLVPVAGDLVTAAFSAYIIREAARMGAPKWLLGRMVWNAGLDVLSGVVPVVGDAFDAAWKANKRNVALLERWFDKQQRRAGR